MLKVAKLFQEPEQSLILSSEKVNADDGADKSLFRTIVQPVTQPKEPTDLKLKKKKIPPSSKPKSSYQVRVILPKKQVAETQHAKEPVATADATKSLGASDLAKDQVNQPKIAEAKKVQDQNIQEEVKESGLESMKDVTFDQIMDEIDEKNKDAENAKSFETPDSTDNDSQEELCTLTTKVNQLESIITKQVTDVIPSSMPSLVADTLKENLLSLLSEALKNSLPIEFNAFNTLESRRFVKFQQELSKVIKTKMGMSVKNKVFKGMKANAKGEKWEKNNLESPNKEKDTQNPDQTKGATFKGHHYGYCSGGATTTLNSINIEHAPPVNEENALVLHASVEKSSEEDTLEKKVTNDEPLIKKLKLLILTSSIPSLTPLKSIMPEPL
ncbi:hypothetical protein Tco_0149563 [Tanacetum coccineum]